MPLIRPSRDEDLDAITRIYGHHVLTGTGTFETTPPSLADMTARRADVLSKGLPWLVAEEGGQVLGFAYGNWFKPRPAYRFSVEDSIYLAPEAAGKGLGRALLAELLARLQAVGVRKATLASPEEAQAATGCVMGSVPPFSFNPQVRLVVDPALVERFAEIAFNAGRLDRSIVLDSADYVRIARPALHSLSGDGAD